MRWRLWWRLDGVGASWLLARTGLACLIPLMSPGCSSRTGCRILRLDFAASGTPAPPWSGKTSLRHAPAHHSRENGNPGSHGSPLVAGGMTIVARNGRQGGGHERSRLAWHHLDRRTNRAPSLRWHWPQVIRFSASDISSKISNAVSTAGMMAPRPVVAAR